VFDASASTAPLGASIVSYSWDFGDGSTGTGVLVHHKFSSNSTFHVVLRVTDSNGVSASKSQDVVVGAASAPHAAFTISPTAPLTGQTVNFNGGISTAGGGHSIVGWSWDFGDGVTTSGTTVTHIYNTAGTYSVTLTVTDDAGQTSQATNTVTVSTPSGGSGAPTANFTFSPAAPGVGETVNFNASTSTPGTGHRIVSYAWTFGDGATGTGVTTTHAYSKSGTYSVQLTVTDEAGQSTTSGATPITVGNPPTPTANFTFSPQAPFAGDTVVFDSSSSTTAQGQTITAEDWNFGDSTTVFHCPGACSDPNNRIISHVFSTPGTWVVNLVVTDSAGRTGSHQTNVTVASPNPTAKLTIVKNGGNSITADGSASTATGGNQIANYRFDFGDSTPAVSGPASVVSHTYLLAGSYTVTLTVTDNHVPSRTGTVSAGVTVP
jgi:PKD repeat protein